MKKKLKEKVVEGLSELYQTGIIKSGVELSKEIENITGIPFYINTKCYPAYNFLNLNHKTVFCHLNHGDDPDTEKFKEEYILKSKNQEEFIEKYIKEYKNYPYERFIKKSEFDNFDFKQALYLSSFPNNGIRFNSKKELTDKDLQRKDCHDILTQKTQLELIPFKSRKFSSVFSSQNQSDKLINTIKPYFEELLDIITMIPRQYVIFGSTQYFQIIKSYNKINNIIVDKSKRFGFDIGVKNKAYFTMLKLNWKGKEFYCGIAHSFARQDLPNAFYAMKKYGDLSAEKYIEFTKK